MRYSLDCSDASAENHGSGNAKPASGHTRCHPILPPAACARCMTTSSESSDPQQWWPAKTPFEVVIGAYLTQNTAWKSVERSIGNLDAPRRPLHRRPPRHPRTRSPRPHSSLRFHAAQSHRPQSFRRFPRRSLRRQNGDLRRGPSADLTAVRQQLLALPGVGPETADAILLYALDAPAMVVDEYLRRIVCPPRPRRPRTQSTPQSSPLPSRPSPRSPPPGLRNPQPSPATTTNSTPSSSRSANLTAAAWRAARAALSMGPAKIPPRTGTLRIK